MSIVEKNAKKKPRHNGGAKIVSPVRLEWKRLIRPVFAPVRGATEVIVLPHPCDCPKLQSLDTAIRQGKHTYKRQLTMRLRDIEKTVKHLSVFAFFAGYVFPYRWQQVPE